jgi:hypothetical protein
MLSFMYLFVKTCGLFGVLRTRVYRYVMQRIGLERQGSAGIGVVGLG